MTTFTVKVGRLFVAHNREPRPPSNHNTGWREVVWAKKLEDAEKFADPSAANLWALTWLSHEDFVVTVVPTEVSA
jgi:hypothetical protein